MLSARLGYVLSAIYLASTVLKHYEDQGRPAADLPLVEWSCRNLLYRAQEQLHGFLRNFPNRWVARGLRLLLFPRGRTYFAPSDELGQKIVELIINPTESRERLCDGIYKTREPGNPLGLLQEALELAVEVEPLQRRIRQAVREGKIADVDLPLQVDQALEKNVLSAAEAQRLWDYDAKVMSLIAVDDFAPEELGTKTQPVARKAQVKKAPRKKAAKKKTTKKTVKKPAAAKEVEAAQGSP
jgi:acyl-CoA dehydrogenase